MSDGTLATFKRGLIGILRSRMNTYLAFGLVMLVIVIISLFASGMLAASFNERAKRDLEEALQALAAPIGGTVNMDDASVSGRYQGHITTGQMKSAPGGMGRIFETRLVDAAGGERWRVLVRRPRSEALTFESEYEGPDELRGSVGHSVTTGLQELLIYPGWFEVSYDPAEGQLRLARAMQSRRDIPSPERFERYLEQLHAVAATNRAAQAPA